ncbi:MAG: oligosaccharide flippase family protein [Desulfobacteraceae bacterium]|nr:oligosaccharide flippase family protein [Desulfobacteraceae bacterium]
MYQHLKRLLGESTFYTIGNVVQRSFSMITMPVFTRCMPVSEYGVLAIVTTVKELLSVFFEVGTSAASSRFYFTCENFEEERQLFSTLLLFTSGFGIVLSLLLYFFGESIWQAAVKDVPFHPYIGLTIWTVLVGTVAILPRTLFRVRGQAKVYVSLNLFQTSITVATSVFLIVVMHMGAIGPVISTLAATSLFSIVYLYCLRKHITPHFSWKTVRKSLAFGLPESPVRLANWTLKMSNQLILQVYAPISLVAIYSVGYSVGSILFEQVINGVHWAVQPFYYQMAKEEVESKAKEIFAYIAVYNTVLILAVALFTIFMGKELLTFFAGSKYNDSQPLILIIALSCVFQFLFFIPSRGLYVANKTVYLLPLALSTAVLNLILGFVLIPRFGVMGAAYSTAISYSVRTVMTLIVSQRIYPIPYHYLRTGKALAAFLIILAAGFFLPRWHFMATIILKLLVLGMYPILLYFFGFFEKRELERLHSVFLSLRSTILSPASR